MSVCALVCRVFSEGIAEEEVHHSVDCSQRPTAHYRHHLPRGQVIPTESPSGEPRGQQANGRSRDMTVSSATVSNSLHEVCSRFHVRDCFKLHCLDLLYLAVTYCLDTSHSGLPF